ncbi:MAG TPA: sugar ABC transporter permease [Thermomicrobiales bacterium]|jgi:multiple sugar transport system permease protein|nr:sugar ABC transporter permease [Thermomicrobiales bacterium]
MVTTVVPNSEEKPSLPAASSSWRLLGSARSRSTALWGLFFVGPQLLGLLVFSLIPVIWAMVLSFMEWGGMGARTFVGLENYRDTFANEDFRAAFWHTVQFTAISVPGSVVASLLIAMLVNNVRFKTIYRVIFFLPTVTSSVAISLVWLWALNGDFGLVNTYLREWFNADPPNWLIERDLVVPIIALVSVWSSLGFNMIIFLAGLQGISPTYHEAAQIDGASRWRQFFNITLPLLSPTIFFVTIISLIGAFQVFDLVYVMTNGGPGNASSTMVYYIYRTAFMDFRFGQSAAIAMVLFVIIMLVTLVQFWGQRRWVHYDD